MNIWKVILTFPYLLKTLSKARSMTKKVLRDPNMVSEELRYIWLQKRARYFAWVLDTKITVLGLENWPSKGCVMIANHQSNFDPLALLYINDFSKFAPLGFIAKKELRKEKFIKNFINLIDVLFLDRENPRQALEVFSAAKDLIRVPRTMVIFPEGTRSNSSEVQEFKPGAFKIAYQAYVPIVPVSIINSYQVFDKTHTGKKNIKIIIHKPWLPQNFIHIPTNKLAENIQNIIATSVENQNKDDNK